MQAKNLTFDESAEREVVEELDEPLIDFGFSELLVALVEEAVVMRHRPRFVISAEQVETVGILDFEAEQQTNALDRVVPSVDIVAQEQIPCVRLFTWCRGCCRRF